MVGDVGMSADLLTDAEIASAQAINICDIARERGVTFDRKGNHAGPCPRCGGTVLTMGARGAEFYVVPDGGRVRPADAQEIIQRTEIVVADSGLFSDTPQSWRFRHA